MTDAYALALIALLAAAQPHGAADHRPAAAPAMLEQTQAAPGADRPQPAPAAPTRVASAD